MTEELVEVQRPDRWDHPLNADMSPEQVGWLLRQQPFSEMNADRFAKGTPLADILSNDTRLLRLESGDVLFREGQYGGSAYLVLDGQVRIALSKLLASDQPATKRKTFPGLRWLAGNRQSVSQRHDARKRPRSSSTAADESPIPAEIGYRGQGTDTRVFLQDVPGVLSQHATSTVSTGELFGEMSAVTRSPREFTAFAEQACSVLEIRWQGLKLLKQDPAFRRLLDERYRTEVLRTHLRETPLFRYLPAEALEQVVASVKLESFGNLEWYAEYRKQGQESASKRITREPLIAEEGSYATGLWIVRGGFARLSSRQGAGHRTLAYLGKGQMYGLRELVHNSSLAGQSAPLPYQESLRAIGYVDSLCIPKPVVNEHVLPYVRRSDLPPPIGTPRYRFGQPVVDAPLETPSQHVDTGLLEFLVDQRLMNGRKAMLIDTERCTRCDDCVRACGTAHGGQAVFVREGPQYGQWMFPQACMHCEDPVCMIGCPTGAIHRDHDSGLVDINSQTCIGCKSCAESCPYQVIRMVKSQDEVGRAKVDQQTGLPILQASKCDFCSSVGQQPLCQSACPHGALVRIDVGDLQQVSRWMRDVD